MTHQIEAAQICMYIDRRYIEYLDKDDLKTYNKNKAHVSTLLNHKTSEFLYQGIPTHLNFFV